MVDLQTIKVEEPPNNLHELLANLEKISVQSLECKTEETKLRLLKHKLLIPLKQCLLETKTRYQIKNSSDCIDHSGVQELTRLNNMLEGMGFIGAEINANSVASAGDDQADYSKKLSEAKEQYEKYDVAIANFEEHFITNAIQLLDEHSKFRPVTQSEKETMRVMIQNRFRKLHIVNKQATCENLMLLKNRFCDARRKRRNFSKAAIDILNDYFNTHIHNPYPSDDVKEELARKCNISVSQVNNWFGNKRIRYKKSITKNLAKSDVSMSSVFPSIAPLANGAAAVPPYGMLAAAVAGASAALAPYSLPDSANFDLSAYTPQIMQYGAYTMPTLN